MSVKIIIERNFKEPLNRENLLTIEGFRIPAMTKKGYISGETLINCKDPSHALVISSWVDFDSFNEWFGSEDRENLVDLLSPYLEAPEKINFFMLGSDALDETFETIVHDL